MAPNLPAPPAVHRCISRLPRRAEPPWLWLISRLVSLHRRHGIQHWPRREMSKAARARGTKESRREVQCLLEGQGERLGYPPPRGMPRRCTEYSEGGANLPAWHVQSTVPSFAGAADTPLAADVRCTALANLRSPLGRCPTATPSTRMAALQPEVGPSASCAPMGPLQTLLAMQPVVLPSAEAALAAQQALLTAGSQHGGLQLTPAGQLEDRLPFCSAPTQIPQECQRVPAVGTSSGPAAALDLEKLHRWSFGEIFVEADFDMLELTSSMLSE